ncbi:Putative AAA+ ATPase domain, ATPase, AAA-type, core [Colletotrichum destructivum]|uniref:AAA+ ATPase domain, ATPase, AAA-type, core n=1 Tax=Colletotrichum destructivum TaxID=34406 RepID=A0AAX4I0A1_9PEZI|nr:Putative AAA+ ATPase domain, ATPase, AAA-type, core [Colletotrichum destructivum]
MILVDTMYGLHEATAEATKYDMDPEIYDSQGRFNYTEHLNFYQDAMYFMRRIRQSHKRLVSFEQDRQEKIDADLKARRVRPRESATTKEISTKAFLKGEPAKVMQVDWDAFTCAKGETETSIMTPMEIITGEPESQTILLLNDTRKQSKKPNLTPLRQDERVLPTRELLLQQPLPERIKIHSEALVDVFLRVTKSGAWPVARDGSFVFLRPYHYLVHYQSQLRDRLATLEKLYENYNGTESKQVVKNGAEKSSPNEEWEKETKHNSTGDKRDIGDDGVDDEANRTDQDVEDPDSSAWGTSITALLHLRCLIQFIDTEIEPKRNYINSSQCTRIHFHDLWYLFKPGDKVISQEERQVYVVLAVQTPYHKVEGLWQRWNRPRVVAKNSESDSDGGNDEKDGDDNPFILSCAYIDFDGKAFGPVAKKFNISPFGELKSIKSLPVYPLRYARDPQAQQNIALRGQMLLDVAKFKAMYYVGATLDNRDEIDSQVVIDFNEALADEDRRKAWEPKIAPPSTTMRYPGEVPNLRCSGLCCVEQSVHLGYFVDLEMTENYVKTLIPANSLQSPSLLLSPRSLEDTLDSRRELTETEYLVMTYRVFGFVLRSRKWAQLDLTLLRYENSNNRNLTVNAFEKLELPEGHREMVKSLVIQHFRHRQSAFERDEQTDLIQGKGKGLILLLHGAPGVGKTTTAEGIAELFRKPLFQITCGDLGTTAKEVETELEKNFALASRWGCILLLDEADVFLSARERMDFTRNGLVAVFLRVLEYYAGILFLTTNRIGDFDEAFASRIHMSLYYPELDEQKTLKVFRLNLELIEQRFQKQGRTILFDPSSIEDFAQQHFREHKYNRWNGRQIRNACQTALALAEFDAQGGVLEVDGEVDRDAVVKLQLKYFRTVQRAYLDFGKYLGDIQGTQGDRRAIDYKLRARSDTPYQTRPSLFSQREESRSFRGHHGAQQHLYAHRNSSEMSQSNLGSQQDPWHQRYRDRPTTPNTNSEQQQGPGPYTPQMANPQAYKDPVGNTGGYEIPASFGQPGSSSQHGQMEAQYQQGRQQGQSYESPQPGFQPGYGRETPQRSGVGFNTSQYAHRTAQHHQSPYTYENSSGQEGAIQDHAGSTQDPGANVPHPVFRHS